jgi:hypothetical protein
MVDESLLELLEVSVPVGSVAGLDMGVAPAPANCCAAGSARLKIPDAKAAISPPAVVSFVLLCSVLFPASQCFRIAGLSKLRP